MPDSSLFAIILAAGESKRFGTSKQLAEFEGASLVARAVRLAEAVCNDRSVLVVGSDWKRVLAACGQQRGFFVRNDNYESGMASSIACGVAAVSHTADAVLLLMADQPLISAEDLQSLIARWRQAPENIVVSEYSGVQGPPVIFPAPCFDSLTTLEGDQGARAILNDPRYSLSGIAIEAASVDIDTAEDLARLTGC
jgi:CTP:molybdopterin cytidylyltransferase MocA